MKNNPFNFSISEEGKEYIASKRSRKAVRECLKRKAMVRRRIEDLRLQRELGLLE